MAGTISPSPARRGLLIAGLIILMLSASTALYFGFMHAHPPRWAQLTIPLQAAVIGLLSLLPEYSRVSLAWRRRVAVFFFALSAVELILFFTKG
jgi:hypothetical protein